MEEGEGSMKKSSSILKKSASLILACARPGPSSTPTPPPPPPAADLPAQPDDDEPAPPPPPSSPSRPPLPTPPSYFICPISTSLMYDPVAVPSGHSYERICIETYIDIGFFKPDNRNLPSSSSSSSSSAPVILTPNFQLKNAILDWCHNFNHPLPLPILRETALEHIKRLQPLPPPSETLYQTILRELQEPFPSSQHSALTTLIRIPFCTNQILAALVPCLTDSHRYQELAAQALYILSQDPPNIQMIHKTDGAVYALLDILRSSTGPSSSTTAACKKIVTGVIYRLAADDQCRHAIGLTYGGIRILLHQFCTSYLGRKRTMLAIFYLCLNPENLEELVAAGGVEKLVTIVDNDSLKSSATRRYALILLHNVVVSTERGREEMLEGKGIEVLVKRIVKCKNHIHDEKENDRHHRYNQIVCVHCLNVMYRVCILGLTRFREAAAAAATGAEEVLAEAAQIEEWGNTGRNLAKGMLNVIRGVIHKEDELDGDLKIDIYKEIDRVETGDSDDEEMLDAD